MFLRFQKYANTGNTGQPVDHLQKYFADRFLCGHLDGVLLSYDTLLTIQILQGHRDFLVQSAHKALPDGLALDDDFGKYLDEEQHDRLS